MKPTLKQVADVVETFCELIPFFPKSEGALKVVIKDVHRFVGSQEELAWLATAAPLSIDKYEGLPCLRAVFETRYKPADVSPEEGTASFARREMEKAQVCPICYGSGWEQVERNGLSSVRECACRRTGKPVLVQNMKRGA